VLVNFVSQDDLGRLDAFCVQFAAENAAGALPRHVDQLAIGESGRGVERKIAGSDIWGAIVEPHPPSVAAGQNDLWSRTGFLKRKSACVHVPGDFHKGRVIGIGQRDKADGAIGSTISDGGRLANFAGDDVERAAAMQIQVHIIAHGAEGSSAVNKERSDNSHHQSGESESHNSFDKCEAGPPALLFGSAQIHG
jgi:hypothetical protein